ncbi:MAG: GNAT family N-acetyltransferase [Salinibacterium sp.]|nr:GNAT family N-acetyltransferase [Salinibacterium sp.]
MTRIVVRRATVADAHAIAVVHVRSWQETYAHLIAWQRLGALDVAAREARWREILSASDEDAWVGGLDGDVVAWVTTAYRDPERQPRDRELNGMYSLASAHGSGVGQALLDEALGDAPAFLWVAADNPRAQAFYRRNGFAADGVRDEYPLLDTPIEIVRFVR